MWEKNDLPWNFNKRMQADRERARQKGTPTDGDKSG